MSYSLLKDHLNFENAKEYTLSIRLRSDGFSFSIHSFLIEKEYIYEAFKFRSNTSFIAWIEDMILSNELLLLPYRKVNILVASNRFTLVPNELYDEDQKQALFNLSFDHRREQLLTDQLTQCGAVNLFGLAPELYAFLMRTLCNPVFHHHTSVLIEYFALRSKLGNSAKMICQVHEQSIDLVCFSKGRLLLANQFEIKHINDAAYFILNCWQNIAFDAHKDLLQMMGYKPSITLLQPILENYLANIEPVLFPSQIYSSDNDSINSPFDLIALDLCVL